jgi:pyrimidine-specific ribonucleoside hydrolase
MIGKFANDVDDGLALILALSDTNLQIEGISFVHGVDYAEKVTDKLLGRYAPNRTIPTYKGADDSTCFGQETAATKALAEALKEPLTILALGPMTNIGTLLELHPEVASNVQAMTYCAGRTPGKVFTPEGSKVKFSDYNFDLDPKATAAVLNANVPLLLSGYDCSENLFLTKDDFKFLKQSKDKTDRWLFRKMKSWNGLWRTFFGSKNGFIPFDCPTVGALLYADEFEITESIPAFIEVRENDTRSLVKSDTKPYLFVEQNKEGHPVSYCHSTKAEFKKRLLKALGHPDYQ